MNMLSIFPKQGASILSVGITTGTLGVLFDLSFAALIFSNSLSDYLSAGIGFVLFSAAAARIMVALMSSFPGTVSDLAAIPTAILSWSTGMVVREMPPTATPEALLITVIVSIALTSLLTGVFLWTLGKLKLGNIVRSLPNSVIGGFVASSGLLLVKGGIEILLKQPLDKISFQSFSQSETLMQWLPGVLLALYLVAVTRRYRHSLVIASSLVGAIALFYITLSLWGISPTAANTQGLTLGIPALQTTWQLLSWPDLWQINWQAIASQWMCAGTVSVLTAVLLLMNVKGMEMVIAKDIDFNHELKVAGSANVLLGIGGGILAFHSMGSSILMHRLGGRSRWVTIISAVTFILLPLIFSSWLTYFPTSILGGLLLYLGLSCLQEWVWRARKKMSPMDYCIVQLIWVVSGVVGFLQALALGWAIAIGLLLHQLWHQFWTSN
ncbi:MAG: sulfate permease, SulP family [Phormidesmis priestleyi Ana]|uniref:Sulfate permease, SulP family n=1 Tax=Phormidesmis priestleyi Ana TaxID=1666911 RepID=A0A0N8KLZ9_9CYAN|nr:MAG: sulfate permease, SulP family [Phormidesmis priestleyi Ana]